MIKAIIFDYGYVISFAGWYDIAEKYKDAYGLDKNIKEIYNVLHDAYDKLKVNSIAEERFWHEVTEGLSISKKEKDNLKKIVLNINENKIDSRILDLIKGLKEKYYTIMLTNNVRFWLRNDIKRYKLNKYFNKIFSSDDLKMKKPDEIIYKTILDKLELKPGECIFIDDQPRNIETANKLGINSILYICYKQLLKDLSLYNIEY